MTRSVKKGPFVDPTLEKHVVRAKASSQRSTIKTWKRNSMVTPDLVGLTIAIHDGRRFLPVFLTENMVGHYLGEFAPTRTFRLHSGQRKSGETAAPETTAAPAGTAASAATAAAPAATKAPATTK